MKVYKNEYRTPEFLLLSAAEEDILTSSPLTEDAGTDTPIVDEDGERRK